MGRPIRKRMVSATMDEADALVRFMFKDTVTARMLRLLCFIGSISQAEFMGAYHRICDRKRPSRSSYSCNWARHEGRFFVRLRGARIDLLWVGPEWRVLIERMSDAMLQRAYEAMERHVTSDPKLLNGEMPDAWLAAIREEIARRQART